MAITASAVLQNKTYLTLLPVTPWRASSAESRTLGLSRGSVAMSTERVLIPYGSTPHRKGGLIDQLCRGKSVVNSPFARVAPEAAKNTEALFHD
jgi:hypothetical protein